jgi:hypothetical protein
MLNEYFVNVVNCLTSVNIYGDLEVHKDYVDTTLFVDNGMVGINTETPNKQLTVNGSISSNSIIYASYFEGIFIDWMTLVRGFKIEPVFNSSIGTGDVYDYVYSTSSTDKTYYRYIATDGSEDSFYEFFSGGVLSNLLARKQIII